ncbi:MAG TPA: hypothetical protein VHU82_02220 [Vicinamibacterales bacterium]|nr:hypothetical protein [Vicinamibacterales bacterium]
MRVHVPAAISVLALTMALGAESTDRLARTVALAGDTPIYVNATIADITITGSDRSDVSVEVVRRAPSAADLERYPAAIEERADGLHIDAVQADEGRDANLKTAITIAAPAAAVFRAIRVFEGRVSLTNLSGACDADLRRGAILATHLAGRVRLEAGLGSVDVRDAALTPGGMMRLRVFNGPVRVRFAAVPASARILAVTFNGSIASDIPLTMKDKFGPRFGETTIGGGDPVMSIDVVKGDITINAPRP